MAKFKKTTTDKTELKKKQATPMADFRTILLKSKIQPASITTPIFSVVFPVFVFTFITERKKNYLHTMESRKISTMIFPNSNEVSSGSYPFIGTGPIFLHS